MAPKPVVTIEPLDVSRHDRAAFSCGVAQVDNFFRKTANKLALAGNARVWVMADPAGSVIGFYALNAHAVSFEALPPRYARTRPSSGLIPAGFIAMIGVGAAHQGRGYGGVLLVDALKRLARASTELGLAVVMLDVLDCGDAEKVARRKALYLGYGFEPLPSRPLRLFLPVATAAALP